MSYDPIGFERRKARFAQALRNSIEANKRAYAHISDGKFPEFLLEHPDFVFTQAFKSLHESLEIQAERCVLHVESAKDPQALLRTESDANSLSYSIQILNLVETVARAQMMLRSNLASAIDAVRRNNKRELDDLYKQISTIRPLNKDEEEFLSLMMQLFGEELRKRGGQKNG